MESDLLEMKTSLADSVPRRCVKKALDGVGRGFGGSRAKVDRAINNSVTAITQDAYELEGAIVDESADGGGTRKVSGRHIAQEMPSEEGERRDGGLPARGEESKEESGE